MVGRGAEVGLGTEGRAEVGEVAIRGSLSIVFG